MPLAQWAAEFAACLRSTSSTINFYQEIAGNGAIYFFSHAREKKHHIISFVAI